MYRCDTCGRSVAAKPGDPVHVTSRGHYCATCLSASATSGQDQPKAKPDGRGAAAKARWANMTAEQRAARVAAMQAGRKKP